MLETRVFTWRQHKIAFNEKYSSKQSGRKKKYKKNWSIALGVSKVDEIFASY